MDRERHVQTSDTISACDTQQKQFLADHAKGHASLGRL